MKDTNEKLLFTPAEIRREFSISNPTLNAWCENGALDKITIPGSRRVYITAQSVNRLLKKH